MEWNAENQLKRVTKNGVEVASFSSDPLGRRVEKVAGGVTTSYTYDEEAILRQVTGTTATRFAQGPGIRRAARQGVRRLRRLGLLPRGRPQLDREASRWRGRRRAHPAVRSLAGARSPDKRPGPYCPPGAWARGPAPLREAARGGVLVSVTRRATSITASGTPRARLSRVV